MEDVESYRRLASDVQMYGHVALALAMAKETNMISGLCTAQQPLSSSLLASQLKLKERYVREVLNSLTVAGLVQLENGTGDEEGEEARYWVPHSCREVLQKASSYTFSISASARQFADLRKCFDEDGPNGYGLNMALLDVIDEWAVMEADAVTEAILKTPGLRQLLEKGVQAMEVGCGTGRLSFRLASMFPKSQFTLSDINSEVLERARQQAEKEGLTNVSFRILDLCQLPDELQDTFDYIFSSDVIHDLPYPLKALQEISRILKPGGHYSLVDEFVSTYVANNLKEFKVGAATLYSLSAFHCIPGSYQQPDSDALGSCWGTEKATELVKAAGMTILEMIRPKGLEVKGVCMCQKPA